MTTDGWVDLNTYTTVALLSHLDHLRKERMHKEAADLLIEARAYALRIAAAERMLAIHNRRATEAEDQRHELSAADVLSDGPLRDEVAWRLIRGLVGCEVAEGRTGHLLAGRLIEWADQRASQPALTADEVRAVVRAASVALLDERMLYIVKPQQPTMNEIALEAYGIQKACDAVALQGDDLHEVLDAIASGVAEKLTGRAVDPARREADLREAVSNTLVTDSGCGATVDPPSDDVRDVAPAEYARSKAGA